MNKFLTKECYAFLISEIQDIKNIQMPAIAEEISIARSHGDLRENAQYSSAKEKQRMIESRLNELEDVIGTHTVIELDGKTFNKVSFGCNVEITFEDDKSKKSFKILSDYDSDISKGIISINSPISKAIIGLSHGESTELIINGKEREITISKIS
jgi:transcription elongation factor GreA